VLFTTMSTPDPEKGSAIRKRRDTTPNPDDDDKELLRDIRSTPTRADDYRALWVAHRSFMNQMFFFIIFVMLCITAMNVFFLWSPSVPDSIIKGKKFFFFISLPLFIFALLLLCLFRKEPKFNIFILFCSSGIAGYAIGVVTVVLFESIETFNHD